ncbi:MAG: hypothetical protein V5A27_08405 [Halapricum sp.]
MGAGNSTYWNAVEQWSPTLFLAGGGLLVGHAAVQGIKAFTAMTTPPDLFVTTGHLVALLGLLGLYPVLVDRTPRLARVAVAVAAIPLAGWVVMTATQFLTVAGVVPSMTDALPGAVGMLVAVSTALTYVLFGVATLRVGGDSRTVGVLVLAPAALIVVLLVASLVMEASAILGLIIGGGFALSMLALGARLRSWDRRTEYTAPTTDATAG